MVNPNHTLGVPGLSARPEPHRRKQRGEAPTATAHAEVYAGSGFFNSPSPSSLPLPRFSLKKDAPAVGECLGWSSTYS
ncbi:hypothetical protein MUK42_05126 [Musa troglodytarum]|uniref:Uncharacterized protein n=1 Tax=Musa troglodytarum TaxID=320322 RepID=A0A9E7JE89_9LILI|nr:hypothetical protein MUK42_05126 [Musa troglodytarum]